MRKLCCLSKSELKKYNCIQKWHFCISYKNVIRKCNIFVFSSLSIRFSSAIIPKFDFIRTFVASSHTFLVVCIGNISMRTRPKFCRVLSITCAFLKGVVSALNVKLLEGKHTIGTKYQRDEIAPAQMSTYTKYHRDKIPHLLFSAHI